MNEPLTAPEAREADDLVDPVEISTAQELVQTFLKCLKGYRLYLPNNQVLRGFVEKFFEGLSEFHCLFGDLCFRVSQYEVRYRGTAVYANEKKEESLAFRLFINGIREFTFHEGVPIDEVSDFLQAIHRAFDAKTSIDDILTLLWERDLEYITFIILDDFFDEGERAEYEDFLDEGSQTDETANSAKAAVQPLLDRLLAKTEDGDEEPPLPDIYHLDEEDFRRIADWGVAELERDLILDLTGMIIELLDADGLADDTQDILVILHQLLESLLGEGKVTEAATLIGELRRNRDSEGAARIVAEALERVNGELVVRAVRPHLGRSDPEERKILVEFLASLGETAVEALIELLDDADAREVALEILRKVGHEHLGLILGHMKDSRSRVVALLVRLTGEIGDPKALAVLRGPLFHDDPLVRRETLRAIERIGTTGAFPLVKEVLNSPEQEIRVLALRALAALPPAIVRDPILNIARGKEFPRRSYFEKKETLLALSRIDDEEVESFLISILKKRPWFRREEYDELRACAVLALARRGNPSSRAAVEARASDRSPQVRRAVAQALRSTATPEVEPSE